MMNTDKMQYEASRKREDWTSNTGKILTIVTNTKCYF